MDEIIDWLVKNYVPKVDFSQSNLHFVTEVKREEIIDWLLKIYLPVVDFFTTDSPFHY